jgi:hypothetical protein
MKTIQIRWTGGRVSATRISAEDIPAYLAKLPLDEIDHLEFGEYIKGPGFATEIKRSDVDVSYQAENFYLDMHTPDGKRVTTAKYSPVQMQQFALHVLQQTYYRFEDLQHRMDGLDK